MTMPNWLTQFGGGFAKLPGSLKELGGMAAKGIASRAIPYTVATQVGGGGGDIARRALGGSDPYYASPYSTMSWGIPQFQTWGLPDPGLFYKQQGGAQLSAYGAALAKQRGGTSPSYAVAAPTASDAAALKAKARRDAIEALNIVTPPDGKPPSGGISSQFPINPPQPGYRWAWDSGTMQYVLEPDPNYATKKMTPYEEAQLRLAEQKSAVDMAQQQWERDWKKQTNLEEQTSQARERQQQQAQWQQRFEWEQQQAAAQQAEAKARYGAQLSANPRSWLEYADYMGKAPVLQPWQIPLMGKQYAGMVAGDLLPGWQQGGSMANLPGLTNPSMQYLARMGPTAQQQWLGYNQAQGGISPQESQFRVQSMAPPGGRNTGLTWGR